jgi:Na+/proline symporter
MSGVLLAIFAYVLVQFVIGIAYSRRMASATDYILAGRSLGPVLVAFSVFASFFGAEALVSSAGAVYENGLVGAVVDPIGYGLALVLAGLLFAGALWRRNLTTFADLFRQRYSPGVEKLVVLMLLPGSLFWAAAQIRAFGQVLSANSTLDLLTAITLAAVIVGSYSIVGGLLADSITDLIQGVVLIVGLLVLSIAVASIPAPPDAVEIAREAAVPVVAAGGGEPSAGPLAWIEKLLVPICGTIVSVELISRFLGSRSANVAMLGTSVGGGVYLLVGLIPIYLGLSAQSLLPGLTEPEQVVPKLAETLLPGVLRIIFVGAIVSAILSTVHSALHGPAAQLSHNILTRIYPDISPAKKLWTARLTVMALCIVAYGISLTSDRIKELVETASAFGSAGVFVVAVFALFTRFGGALAAYGGMISGMGVWIAAKYVAGYHYPYMLALACSLAAYVALALLEPKREPVVEKA